MRERLIAGLVLTCTLVGVSTAEIRLASLFTDHMVLQRGTPIPVWGWAKPRERVTISLGEQAATTRADGSGNWIVRFRPMKAGGPYTLTATGPNTVTVRDVLVGEVWVCSGQSNMQWSVEQSANVREELEGATFPRIRMFTVPHLFSRKPQDTCGGTWQVCTPNNVRLFSAVGYFYGRALHTSLQMPVGLIHASWSGTPAEAWTPTTTLRRYPELMSIFKVVDSLKKAHAIMLREYQKTYAEWEDRVAVLRDRSGRLPERQVDPGNEGFTRGWADPYCTDRNWKEVTVPGNFEKTAGLDIDGAVWYRRTVTIPAAWKGKDLALSLGPVDDFDITYFNGLKVGSTDRYTPNFWTVPRIYTVPANMVEPGEAVLAIRVFDHWGNGGLVADTIAMRLKPVLGKEEGIPLEGTWQFKVEHALPPLMPPTAPRGLAPQHEPGMLYNAMIHPLAPYGIRGAIWYQGESNVGQPGRYRLLLPALISEWRKLWARGDFPFGIVQLANYGRLQENPTESGWAEIREVQAQTAREVKHTGLAVTIDIGEADNIHPLNKQDVGRRLALWAFSEVYDRDTVYAGPTYADMEIVADKIIVMFDHVHGGLEVRGDQLTGFAIAGKSRRFVRANAEVKGNLVVVRSDLVPEPVAVRYGWANNPPCNLYNRDGLPAPPFRTDSWPRSK
jgi:sialate O-acetylesterase